MAVKRGRSCAEDSAPVKERQNLLLGSGHVLVPELEVASVFLFPILVQVDQDIDAAVELELGMQVVIGVDRKLATGLDLMQSAAYEIGIGDDTLNAGERFEKLEHRAAV